MGWFAPRRMTRGLVRPAGALLLVAGAVTGAAALVDRPSSDPDHPRFLNSFDVAQLHSDAVLEQTPDRSARLTVTERLTGSFSGGAGHHLVRLLPTAVAGHTMPVTILSVTGPDGAPRKWHAALEDDDTLGLRITGEPTDSSGTFTVKYRSDGVVVDSGDPRAIWDVKPAEWPEDTVVNGTLTVPASLAAPVGAPAECHATAADCTLTSGLTTEARTYSTPSLSAGSDDEVVVSVGVAPGLFTPNTERSGSRGDLALLGAGLGALTLSGIGAALAASRRRRGSHERVDLLETVVPEGLSPAMAASLLGSPGHGIVGQLLAAAVNGNVRLRVGDEDVLVEHVEWPEGLTAEADAALSVLAPREPGETRSVAGGVRLATEATLAQIRDAPERAGLARRPDRSRVGRRLALAGVGAAVVIPWYAHAQDASFVVGAGSLTAVLAALGVGYGTLHEWRSYTARGRELLGQLEGLRRYVTLRRAERIAFLRNVSGQETAESHEALVYQRLLPYAAVLGLVDEWREQVAESLGSEPTWLPMEQLDRVLGAVDADTIAERLDGILTPMEGRSAKAQVSVPEFTTRPGGYGNFWGGAGGGSG